MILVLSILISSAVTQPCQKQVELGREYLTPLRLFYRLSL